MAEEEQCVRIEQPVPKEEELKGHKIITIDVTNVLHEIRTAAKIFVAIAMNVGFSAATYLLMKYVLHI